MHQRELCLCPLCIARIGTDEEETRVRSLMHIAAIGQRARKGPLRKQAMSGKGMSNPSAS